MSHLERAAQQRAARREATRQQLLERQQRQAAENKAEQEAAQLAMQQATVSARLACRSAFLLAQSPAVSALGYSIQQPYASHYCALSMLSKCSSREKQSAVSSSKRRRTGTAAW